MGALTGRNVVLAVGGGIAAYKSVEVCRALQRAGANVRVCMTDAAAAFIQPLTFESLTRHAVAKGVLSLASDSTIDHVEWGHWAHLMVVAPATADLLARLAAGMANDAPTSMALCVDAPLVLCPAMEPRMWNHPATRHNCTVLQQRGATLVPPESGPLASGRDGVGRLAHVDAVVAAAEKALRPQDLAGARVLVTAGPTHEALDPVRFLTNGSTGKMGVALANAARERGAHVTLIHGPLNVELPLGMRLVPVKSALDMLAAMQRELPSAQLLLMSAAVGDYRPETVQPNKIKKGDAVETLRLVANPDLLVETRGLNPNCVRVGFAAETEKLREHARSKLERKGLRLIVANDVGQADAGFGVDTNRVILLDAAGEEALPLMSKEAVAHAILDRVAPLLNH